MNESDLNFVLALVLVVVVAIGAAGLAMSLFMQGPFSLIGLARPAVKVPSRERKIYFQTVQVVISD